jgi:hypothetical protein
MGKKADPACPDHALGIRSLRMSRARIMRRDSRKLEKIALKAKRACILLFSNRRKILENLENRQSG